MISQTKIDISVAVDVFMNRIKGSCKRSVVHAVSAKISRMEKYKNELELKLKHVVDNQKGFIAKIKNSAKVRRIKHEITSLNSRMIEWLNTVYTYFIGK